VLYHQEYGWDKRFKALVASTAADLIDHYGPQAERHWIAEEDGSRIGCIMLIKDRSRQNTPKTRLLLMEPIGRDLGVARALVR
jgi:hypothetical protein